MKRPFYLAFPIAFEKTVTYANAMRTLTNTLTILHHTIPINDYFVPMFKDATGFGFNAT